MRCIYCNETVIKKGKRKGIQKYQCNAKHVNAINKRFIPNNV